MTREAGAGDRGPEGEGDGEGEVRDEIQDEADGDSDDGDGDPLPAGGGAAHHGFTVDPARAGERIDALIAATVPALSRAAVQRLIDGARVRLNGAAIAKPGQRCGALKARLLAMPIETPIASIEKRSSRFPFTFARSRDQMASSIAIHAAKLSQNSVRHSGETAKAKPGCMCPRARA